MHTAAEISEDGLYRYSLHRRWAPKGPCAAWIMLNPSTADAQKDDATIRKCIGFSRTWECTAILVVNLFAVRVTDSKLLASYEDPEGPQNAKVLSDLLKDAAHDVKYGSKVIVAWGRNNKHPKVEYQGKLIRYAAEYHNVTLQCLGTNADGSPKHPLMLGYATPLVPWP